MKCKLTILFLLMSFYSPAHAFFLENEKFTRLNEYNDNKNSNTKCNSNENMKKVDEPYTLITNKKTKAPE